MRAAIYARVSTERQERQQTIDSQVAALSAWAQEADHELKTEHTFRDEGYSGARLDRPGLDALRDAVRGAEVDIVAVLSPDRLARKYAYQALLLEEFRRAGCEVTFFNHTISDNPGDQLLLQIQGAVAEYERALLSERFRRGKLQRRGPAGSSVDAHPTATATSPALAMHGVARTLAGGIARNYYRCAGKDRVMTARESACPRAHLDGEQLETAVWEHIRALLADPAQLLAQFERFASGANREAQHAHAAEQQIQTRLARLACTDRRLVDAYQAEAINPEELAERRRSLAEQRESLERLRSQQQKLRGEQVKAQAVLHDLTAFCDRIRGRLDEASFADKQTILQLVVERIIVGDGSLEIRHVIPLRSPPPGRNGPTNDPSGRLRSDRVNPAPLPRGVQQLGDGGLEPVVRVGDDQLDAAQPALPELAQESRPERLGFRRPDVHRALPDPPEGCQQS